MGDEDGMTVAKQLRSQMESKKEAVWGKPAASDICNGISGIYAGGFFPLMLFSIL